MKLEQLRQKLLAAARSNPPSDSVPYAFEKRITALLRARPALDFWAQWAQALWRAALPCVGIMLVLGSMTYFASSNGTSGTAVVEDFPQDFQQTMLAAVDQVDQSVEQAGEVW
jgi:hypothetical protein